MLDIPRKVTLLAQVGETVVSLCFVGCLGQARKRCTNRCCCGLRNYASDVRPTDPLAACVESPSLTLASGIVSCTSNGGLKYIKKLSRPIEESRHWCVCVFSSRLFWTSSSLDIPAGVTQEEGHTGFFIHLLSAVRALIFLARKIQPFLSLVDREVELCVLTI